MAQSWASSKVHNVKRPQNECASPSNVPNPAVICHQVHFQLFVACKAKQHI